MRTERIVRSASAAVVILAISLSGWGQVPASGPSAANPATTLPTASSISDDPILNKLEAAKQEFVAAVQAAHAELLGVIDRSAKAASEKGRLDTYKNLLELRDQVEVGILVPDTVKDTAIRGANAKLI